MNHRTFSPFTFTFYFKKMNHLTFSPFTFHFYF